MEGESWRCGGNIASGAEQQLLRKAKTGMSLLHACCESQLEHGGLPGRLKVRLREMKDKPPGDRLSCQDLRASVTA